MQILVHVDTTNVLNNETLESSEYFSMEKRDWRELIDLMIELCSV